MHETTTSIILRSNASDVSNQRTWVCRKVDDGESSRCAVRKSRGWRTSVSPGTPNWSKGDRSILRPGRWVESKKRCGSTPQNYAPGLAALVGAALGPARMEFPVWARLRRGRTRSGARAKHAVAALHAGTAATNLCRLAWSPRRTVAAFRIKYAHYTSVSTVSKI